MSRAARYAERRVVSVDDGKPFAGTLIPVNGDVVGELLAELGGSRPTTDRLYTWRTTGFVLRQRSKAPAVLFPHRMRGNVPVTTRGMVRRWWRRVKYEAKKVGEVPMI